MAEALHHLGLGLSCAALGGAGIRVASLAAPDGLERVVAAAVLAAAAACAEALLLGLAGAGSDPWALGLAAGATWLAAWRFLPAPALSPGRELAAWWRRAPLGPRLLLGAVVGAGLAWAVWLLRNPALGHDSLLYHLPEIAIWIDTGHPGAVEYVWESLPVGSYPLTNEVLLAWGMGIARSFVVVSVWAPAMMLLLGGAGWLGLRTLAVGRWPAGLAVAALCLTPVLTHFQMNGAYTDLPSLAWLVSAAALTAAATRRPALLAPAIVAAGLAVGTKTTALPVAVLLVVAGVVANGRRLRPLAAPLLAATALALVSGGYWYLRNLVDHGSPLWPFVRTPWGDALPAPGIDTRFLEAPRATLDRLGDDYRELFAGGILLLAAALVAPVVARRRAVVAGAAVVAVSVVLWLNAPYTGTGHGSPLVTLSTLRYLLPALAAAATTLCLAAREPGPGRAYGTLALAAALLLGAIQTFRLGNPSVPAPGTPLLGAAVGVLAAFALAWASWRLPPLPPAVATALAVGALGIVGAAAAPGFLGRWVSTVEGAGAPAPGQPKLPPADVMRWLDSRHDFRSEGGTLSATPAMFAVLAGDRLQHRLELLRPRESCPRVRHRARRGWVLVVRSALALPRLFQSAQCLRGRRPIYESRAYVLYGG